MLVAAGRRIVWVNFDVATIFSSMNSREKVCCDYEIELLETFENLLVCITSFNSILIIVADKMKHQSDDK